MDDMDLAALEHANMVEAMATICSLAEGAAIRRDQGVAIIATDLDFLLFNQVIVEHGSATPAALSDAIAFMRDRANPFAVNLRVGVDDRFLELTSALGLVPVSVQPWMPGMALHPLTSERSPVLPPDHEIHDVTDVAGLEDHVRVGSAGFELPEELLRAVIVPRLLARRDVTVYVGYTDGQPVSTGLGLRTGNTIGVYNIATIPSARGRGYGAAMTRRVAADGAALGCDVAILQASEMGLPIYERLGYRTVLEYAGHVERPAGG